MSDTPKQTELGQGISATPALVRVVRQDGEGLIAMIPQAAAAPSLVASPTSPAPRPAPVDSKKK